MTDDFEFGDYVDPGPLPEMHLDVETHSTIDLVKRGPYKYVECPDTDLWCGCYAFNDGPVQDWLPGQPCPPAIVAHVEAGGYIIAHNAMFERLVWKHILTPRYGWPQPNPKRWVCTMARAYAMALPGSLEGAARAVGIADGKDLDGRKLMLKMAKPVKSRLFDDGTLVWAGSPENLARLIRYCRKDVEVERELHHRLFPLSEYEYGIWLLDQEINDRGIGADLELAKQAECMAMQALDQLNENIFQVSDGRIDSTTKVQQIVRFCRDQGVHDITSLRADQLVAWLECPGLPPRVRSVLELRAEASKVSVKKITALIAGSSTDSRVRGLLSYHVATTGRWAGRRFQPQNIKRPVNKDQNKLIGLVQTGSLDAVREEGSPLEVIGDIIRGMIVPKRGCKIFAADYSNIEGRVLAWLAGEDWKLDSFRQFDRKLGPDIYKLSYSRAFGVPIETIDDNMRQLGKVMELALGYQGGVGAFQGMARNYRIEVPNDRAQTLRDAWRRAHPKTCEFWKDLEQAAIRAVNYDPSKKNSKRFHYAGSRIDSANERDRDICKIRFHVEHKGGVKYLIMQLPSGRRLFYPHPEIRKLDRFPKRKSIENDDDEAAVFEENANYTPVLKSVDEFLLQVRQEAEQAKQDTRTDTLTFMSTINPSNVKRLLPDPNNTGNWARITTYGGSLAENATQAVARDIMAAGMKRVEEADYPVILTVHDEVVAEASDFCSDVNEFEDLMVELPEWATGLPVAAKAWFGDRYKKD